MEINRKEIDSMVKEVSNVVCHHVGKMVDKLNKEKESIGNFLELIQKYSLC